MPEPPILPAIASAPLSVVLPARNEAAHLERTLTRWIAYLESLQRDYEILLIDDGSTDQTAALTETLAGRSPRLRLLRHATSLGFGAALRTGLAAAQHPLFMYSECSDAYDPADLKALLEVIDQVDVAAGDRVWVSGRRGFAETRYRWLVRWLFGVRLHDVNCAFKLFRRSLFARLPIQSDGPFVHCEILAKANFLGGVLTEVPVKYRPPSGSEATKWQARPKQTRAEMIRMFSHPDFGPAQLPAEATRPELTPLPSPSPEAAPPETARSDP